MTAPAIFQHAIDTTTFESSVEQVLVPELEHGDVVIWDNLKPHQAAAVGAAVEGAGVRVIPLPPWSPDRTPIEEMLSKLKGALRSSVQPCRTFLRKRSRNGSNPGRRTQFNREAL